MATTQTVPTQLGRPRVQPSPKRRWSWAQYLALIGVPILAFNVWTVVAWLADGPYWVTEFQDRNSTNWYAAKTYEALIILVSITVLVKVIRGCLRERKILTFDTMFCLAGSTIFYADFSVNFFNPTFLASSNFVSVNNACGHMPFVVNPDCGQAPDPILFFFLLETFGILGAAMVLTAGAHKVRQRWPHISTKNLIILTLVVGIVIDFVCELPAIALGLWTYTVAPHIPLGHGGGLRYPLIEVLAGGLFFGLLVVVRLFKDDKGRSFVERGLDHYKPPVQKAVALLALYSFFQLVNWIPGTMPTWWFGFYEPKWKPLPSWLANDVCNSPGVEGTRYGPCPGSPDYRQPGRHSLPGKSP